MSNKITSLIINNEKRIAIGTNLYDIIIDGCRSLKAVLCRANGIEQKASLNFQLEFEDGLTMLFTATFHPTDDGCWVKLVDIIPCSDAGNMYL